MATGATAVATGATAAEMVWVHLQLLRWYRGTVLQEAHLEKPVLDRFSLVTTSSLERVLLAVISSK